MIFKIKSFGISGDFLELIKNFLFYKKLFFSVFQNKNDSASLTITLIKVVIEIINGKCPSK